MKYKDLVRAVSKETQYTQKDIDVVLTSMFKIIEDTVTSGEDVTISKFGKFIRYTYPAKNCRNISTGEKIETQDVYTPKFRVGAEFKRKVRGSVD